jgi:hypothetical protein
MALADPGCRCVDLRAIRDVANLRLRSDLGRDPRQALGAAREEDAMPAATGQEPRRGRSDSPRSTGDDGDANRRNSRLLAP